MLELDMFVNTSMQTFCLCTLFFSRQCLPSHPFYDRGMVIWVQHWRESTLWHSGGCLGKATLQKKPYFLFQLLFDVLVELFDFHLSCFAQFHANSVLKLCSALKTEQLTSSKLCLIVCSMLQPKRFHLVILFYSGLEGHHQVRSTRENLPCDCPSECSKTLSAAV